MPEHKTRIIDRIQPLTDYEKENLYLSTVEHWKNNTIPIIERAIRFNEKLLESCQWRLKALRDLLKDKQNEKPDRKSLAAGRD